MARVSDDELYRQYETVNIYRRGPGAKIEFNRPDRLNAFTPDMLVNLEDRLRRAEANRDVGVVVLAGAGRAVCAGGDVMAMAEGWCNEHLG